MTLQYLENLLATAKTITSEASNDAEDVKIKTIDAIKELFPLDYAGVTYTLSGLNFKMRSNSQFGIDMTGVSPDVWLANKRKLISIIESRIEILKHKQSNVVPKPISSGIRISDYTKPLEERITGLEEQNRELIINLQSERTQEIKQLADLNFWLWVKKTFAWAIVSSIIGGAFLLGLYFGGSKFDNQKNQLYEDNQRQKRMIDSLNREIKKVINPKTTTLPSEGGLRRVR